MLFRTRLYSDMKSGSQAMAKKTVKSKLPALLRHETIRKDDRVSLGDGQLIAALTAHLERHLGPIEMVFHEILSDALHIDIHWIKPSKRHPFHTLVTSGMAEHAMDVPTAARLGKYAEIFCCLPPDWRVEDVARAHSKVSESVYWPIRSLKELARLPHTFGTWLGEGHTVPNDDPPTAVAKGFRFDCMILLPPMLDIEGFGRFRAGKRHVRLLQMFPLFPEETALLLEQGTEALLNRLADADPEHPDLFNPKRVNVAKPVPKSKRDDSRA